MFRAALIVSGMALLAVPAHGAITLQPGEWQETTTGTEDGKPVPPEVEKTCMSPEEAKDPVKQMQEMLKDPSAGECKKLDVKENGNNVSFVMSCGDPKMLAFEITANFTFISATRYTGTMKAATSMGGKTMTQDKKIEAVRIGDCNPAAQKKK